MSADQSTQLPDDETSGLFPHTRWDLISDVRSSQETDRRRALAELCEIYWFPVYTFIRRRGVDPSDAKDMTQELFSNLIRRESFTLADQNRGRLRNYLQTSASRLIAESWRKCQAEKRGGHETIISIDAQTAEQRFAREPHTGHTPERELDRQWALALLKQVEIRLQSEYSRKGKERCFALLKPSLTDKSNNPHSQVEIAQRLDVTTGAVKQELLRLRRRFRELVYEEVSNTVSKGNADEEMEHLFAALRGA